MERFISKLINIVFCLVFGFIILGSIFMKNHLFNPDNQLFLVLAVIVWLCIFIFGFKKIKNLPELSKKYKFLLVSCILFVFFIIQIIVANELKVTPSWDFGGNFNAASKQALSGSFLDLNHLYPNNYFLIYFLTFIYNISAFLGYTDFLTLSIIINIIFIDLSILLVYLCIKKILGFNYAFFALLLCVLSSPFVTYTPIFYSDTLSMFVPVLMFYLCINISKENSLLKNIIFLICLGLVTFVGYKIKASILVALVAIFIYWLFKNIEFKEKLFNIGVVIISLMMLMVGYNFTEKIILKHSVNANDNPFPYTHWIMMGLNDERGIYGGYYLEDVMATTASTDRVKFNVDVIKKRISERGIGGNIDFYTRKILDAWSDGTYYAPVKLMREPINNSFLHKVVLPTEKYFDYFFYITTGFTIAMYIIMFLSCFMDLKNGLSKVNKKILLRCMLLGIWLFLLLWENRSRYLVNFIPIMIILTTISLADIISLFKLNKK